MAYNMPVLPVGNDDHQPITIDRLPPLQYCLEAGKA
jgi:hypothetical protein